MVDGDSGRAGGAGDASVHAAGVEGEGVVALVIEGDQAAIAPEGGDGIQGGGCGGGEGVVGQAHSGGDLVGGGGADEAFPMSGGGDGAGAVGPGSGAGDGGVADAAGSLSGHAAGAGGCGERAGCIEGDGADGAVAVGIVGWGGVGAEELEGSAAFFGGEVCEGLEGEAFSSQEIEGGGAGEHDVGGALHDEACGLDGVARAEYAGEGAELGGAAVHDGGVHLDRAGAGEDGAAAGVEVRIVLEGGDGGDHGVDRAAAGGQDVLGGGEGLVEAGEDGGSLVWGESVRMHCSGAAVDEDGWLGHGRDAIAEAG